MCQPKPGPRCSGHARVALERCRVAVEQAEATRTRAQAEFRTGSADPDTGTNLRAAAVAADKAYWEAKRAHTDALRAYETTPEGMGTLGAAAAQFDAEGNEEAAAKVRQRLTEAEATRAEQVADLSMSRRHKTRLNEPTTEELAALDQADAEVADKEAAHTTHVTAYEEATTRWRAMMNEVREADRAEQDADTAIRAAQTAALDARDNAEKEAKRLYVEAGVNPRFAGYYAADMALSANQVPGSRYRRDQNSTTADAGPQQALKMKVKRDGPDRPKTIAAKAAAETDEAFQTANTKLVEAVENVKAARLAGAELRVLGTRAIRERQQAHVRERSAAQYALEDAATDLTRATARRDDLRARIGSGLGIEPVTSVSMESVKDQIVRNPDGTTNAYVYNAPSEGFPYGRYIPATGVTTVHGMGPANALVLQNGRKAWLHGHYSRTVRGAGETQSGYQKVVVVAPQEGATPLRNENVANAGYYTFVDSSD